MRRLIPAVALLLAAGLAVAQEPSQKPSAKQDDRKHGKKEMTAIVVATDSSVKTITVKSETPGAKEETLPVAGSAVSRLSGVKAGEKVKLELTTDPATNQESVTSIEKAPEKP